MRRAAPTRGRAIPGAMRRCLVSVSVAVALLGSGCPREVARDPGPSSAPGATATSTGAGHAPGVGAIVEAAIARIDELRSYSAGLAVRVRGGEAFHTSLDVRRPNQMRARTGSSPPSEAPPPQDRTVDQLFDGRRHLVWRTRWTAGRPSAPGELVQADQEALGRPDAPFDTGFAVPASGLAPGRDWLGTVRGLLAGYRFLTAPRAGTVGDHACVTLDGALEGAAALDAMIAARDERLLAVIELARGATAHGALEARLAEAARDAAAAIRARARVRVWLSESDGSPRGFAFVGTGTTSELSVELTHWAPDVALPDAAFALPPGLDAVPDRTAEVQAVRAQAAAAFDDRDAVARARAAVLAALSAP